MLLATASGIVLAHIHAPITGAATFSNSSSPTTTLALIGAILIGGIVLVITFHHKQTLEEP